MTEPTRFLRNFIDTMCIFCGFPAKGAMTAHMLYILERFFEPGCAYSVPKGGTENIARAIHRGGAQFGMDISLNTHVAEILVENGRAVGVKLKNGKVIKGEEGRGEQCHAFRHRKNAAGPGPARSADEGLHGTQGVAGNVGHST